MPRAEGESTTQWLHQRLPEGVHQQQQEGAIRIFQFAAHWNAKDQRTYVETVIEQCKQVENTSLYNNVYNIFTIDLF